MSTLLLLNACSSAQGMGDPWGLPHIEGGDEEQVAAVVATWLTFISDIEVVPPIVDRIVLKEIPPPDAEGRILGNYEASKMVINLEETEPIEDMRSTLYHELCHALDHQRVRGWERGDFPIDPRYSPTPTDDGSLQREAFAYTCQVGPEAVFVMNAVIGGCDPMGIAPVFQVLADDVFRETTSVDVVDVDVSSVLVTSRQTPGLEFVRSWGLDDEDRVIISFTDDPENDDKWVATSYLDVAAGTLSEPVDGSVEWGVSYGELFAYEERPVLPLALNSVGWNHVGPEVRLGSLWVELPRVQERIYVPMTDSPKAVPANFCATTYAGTAEVSASSIVYVNVEPEFVHGVDLTGFVDTVYGPEWRNEVGVEPAD